ncbi:MAG: GH32 C-terminal domain-containing protein [Bacteroidales bacterium]|nr:GH32 C-terminal domain-containing protein [Bacteroidales bacterium]
MKRTIISSAIAAIAALAATTAKAQTINVEHKGDTTVIVVDNPTRYLILPIEEERGEAKVKLDLGRADDTWMDVRLAIDRIDYEVPFELSAGKRAVVKMINIDRDALALKKMRLSDTWDVKNTDYYRPIYHHTPQYGWMNDANGLVYKDGEYHLYFQYNPYGSKWGNMHWGHSVSRDLMHWEHLKPAIARDTLGHIFSGSTVVDKYNSAGFGKDAVIAFYTSASDKNGQIQCMAYSKDNGRTFTKYEGNPILTPFDGLRDFRDPKVFRYEPAKAWYMIVSADKEMRFYKSADLKHWEYVSAFGRGYGAQPNQFECPDFFPMSVNGKQKWVMIVNINPGCLFGGSCTEYFVGDFDGKTFTCDNKPEVAKFLDFGKDHYATVTFSNLGDRIVAVPWMNNWQYANLTPTQQFRSCNALPRELRMYEKDGDYYLSANAVEETKSLRKNTVEIGDFQLDGKGEMKTLGGVGAFEVEADITAATAKTVGIELANDKGERTLIYLDLDRQRVVMDRTESGETGFGKRSAPHDIENNYEFTVRKSDPMTMRQKNSVNYVNDFALGTWAPLSLCEGSKRHFDIFVDKSSVELFVDGGRIAMTNLVFPTKPYDRVRFYTLDGNAKVEGAKAYIF